MLNPVYTYTLNIEFEMHFVDNIFKQAWVYFLAHSLKVSSKYCYLTLIIVFNNIHLFAYS